MLSVIIKQIYLGTRRHDKIQGGEIMAESLFMRAEEVAAELGRMRNTCWINVSQTRDFRVFFRK